jgi:hypothetical protein
VRFELRQAASSQAVPVSVACQLEAGAEVCIGSPGPLAPRTRYIWSAQVDHASAPAVPREFTTGEGPDETGPLAALPPPGSAVQVEIVEHAVTPNHPCGMPDRARTRFRVPGLDEPVALVVTGMGGYPHPFEDPVVLTPDAASVEVTLWGAPACLGVRLVDVAGNARHFTSWCPSRTASSPGEQGGGCSFAAGRPGSAVWIFTALGLTLACRRRARGRSPGRREASVPRSRSTPPTGLDHGGADHRRADR